MLERVTIRQCRWNRARDFMRFIRAMPPCCFISCSISAAVDLDKADMPRLQIGNIEDSDFTWSIEKRQPRRVRPSRSAAHRRHVGEVALAQPNTSLGAARALRDKFHKVAHEFRSFRVMEVILQKNAPAEASSTSRISSSPEHSRYQSPARSCRIATSIYRSAGR